jgi:hypothetical protein
MIRKPSGATVPSACRTSIVRWLTAPARRNVHATRFTVEDVEAVDLDRAVGDRGHARLLDALCCAPKVWIASGN